MHSTAKLKALALGFLLLAATPVPSVNATASSNSMSSEIRQIRIATVVKDEGSNLWNSSLRLDFDSPISTSTANELKKRFTNTPVVTTQQKNNGNRYAVTLNCEGSHTTTDNNGTFDIQYTCTTKGVLAWGFRISPAVQAIVVGKVSEDGLRWWRNGQAMPKNSPHTVGAAYNFHGSMKPARDNDDISYEDRITFRHRVGPGGKGEIKFSGKVHCDRSGLKT